MQIQAAVTEPLAIAVREMTISELLRGLLCHRRGSVSFEPSAARPPNLTHEFRAAGGFYPGCITLKKRHPDYTAAVPTLLQLGADDDWTWPKPCQDLAERATSNGGAPIEVETYEGAAHSFDHPKSKRRTITVSDGRRVQIGTHTAARNAAIKRIRAYLAEAFEY